MAPFYWIRVTERQTYRTHPGGKGYEKVLQKEETARRHEVECNVLGRTKFCSINIS